ncbi:hypothetical protein BS17DRAFT_535264 [Gyrodon lividus]|nr:hypothetical protein BS17DRAFT_535264 [Gyrodon lividus]
MMHERSVVLLRVHPLRLLQLALHLPVSSIHDPTHARGRPVSVIRHLADRSIGQRKCSRSISSLLLSNPLASVPCGVWGHSLGLYESLSIAFGLFLSSTPMSRLISTPHLRQN